MDLWNRSADLLPAQLLDVLLDALESARGVASSRVPWSAKADAKRIDAPTFSKFLEHLSDPRFSVQAIRAGQLLAKNRLLLDVDSTLLPALESAFSRTNRPPSELINPLWQHAAEFYLGRSAYPPPVPVDWAQLVSIGSERTPELHELELFARDPVRRELRIRAKKEIRQTIHQTIEQLGLDMTHVTERKGSPYTLVCTKTRASYERACNRHCGDQKDMRRLHALSAAESPELSPTAERMLAATQRDQVTPSR